jgi:hypothetical protein
MVRSSMQTPLAKAMGLGYRARAVDALVRCLDHRPFGQRLRGLHSLAAVAADGWSDDPAVDRPISTRCVGPAGGDRGLRPLGGQIRRRRRGAAWLLCIGDHRHRGDSERRLRPLEWGLRRPRIRVDRPQRLLLRGVGARRTHATSARQTASRIHRQKLQGWQPIGAAVSLDDAKKVPRRPPVHADFSADFLVSVGRQIP